MNYPIGGTGYVLVEVNSRFHDNTGVKGLDGKELIVDTRYEPLKHVRTCGKVIQVPSSMGNAMIRQIPHGTPDYGPVRARQLGMDKINTAIYTIGGVYKYRRASDIAPEVKVGDTIWFQRTVLNRDTVYMVDKENTDDGCRYIFHVPYDLIVCVEREDAPVMIGGWVFLEPTPWAGVSKNGVILPLPLPEHRMMAILKHAGTPLKGDHFGFRSGDRVFIKKPIQWVYAYKGTPYILSQQWSVLARVVEKV